MTENSDVSASPWAREALGAVCSPTRQWHPEREPRDAVVYIDVSAVSRDSLSVTGAERLAGREAPSRARKIVATGDTLFATIRPRLKRIAQIDDSLNGEVASTAFCVLRPKRDRVDPDFLYFAVQRQEFVEAVARHESGASYPAVRDAHVLEAEIPLPPLPEQRAIGALLRTSKRGLDVENRICTTLRELKLSLTAGLFSRGLRGEGQRAIETGSIPESWDLVPLGRHLTRAQYGLSVKGQQEGRYPILRMNCQVDGRVFFRDLQYVDLDDATFKTFRLEPGDLLFNRTNSFELVGRMAIHREPRDAVFASYLIRLTLDTSVFDPEFINYYFNQPSVQADLKRLASKGVSQANISASKLREYSVPKPSLEEQRGIVSVLASIDKSIDVHERRSVLLAELFEALLDDLISGRRRVTAVPIEMAAAVN